MEQAKTNGDDFAQRRFDGGHEILSPLISSRIVYINQAHSRCIKLTQLMLSLHYLSLMFHLCPDAVALFPKLHVSYFLVVILFSYLILVFIKGPLSCLFECLSFSFIFSSLFFNLVIIK
jgi:hypothetical protein